MRHLITLSRYGFSIKGTQIAELGPGDSLGIGLAALLSGAKRYVGLDIAPFAGKADQRKLFNELVEMYARREPIPNGGELAEVRPSIDTYSFPDHLIDWSDFSQKIEKIMNDLSLYTSSAQYLSYYAPWTSQDSVAANSLDLVVSQAVLEHVDNIEEAYLAMYAWLKPGGYASHVIDFRSHRVSHFWNGHWAYSEWEWRLVRGHRTFLLNREPLSTHIAAATKAGFKATVAQIEHNDTGLGPSALYGRFRMLDPADARTSSATLVLRKV
jgi:SAM-dependent methyltransferase